MDWVPPAIADLTVEAIAPLLDPLPEFILIGTGARLARPPRALVEALDARGIGVETMDTAAACRTYNVLLAEGRSVVAALLFL